MVMPKRIKVPIELSLNQAEQLNSLLNGWFKRHPNPTSYGKKLKIIARNVEKAVVLARVQNGSDTGRSPGTNEDIAD